MKNNSAKAIALCGVMASLAIVFGYIEYLIPLPYGIYGIKLGLANLVVIVMLYTLNSYSAFTINLIRIILCALLFGSFTSFWYSIVGGLLSFAVMLIIKKTDKFSPMGVSICGAIAHNIGQITVAVIIMDEFKIAFYLPVLLITGAITGALIGLATIPIIKMPIFKRR